MKNRKEDKILLERHNLSSFQVPFCFIFVISGEKTTTSKDTTRPSIKMYVDI